MREPWVDRAVEYAFALGWVAFAHVVTSGCWKTLGPAGYTLFMAAVILSSLYGGRGPGLLATAVATADLSFSFLGPAYSFVLSVNDLVFLGLFSGVALLISALQARRQSAEESLRRAHDDLERRVRDRTAELSLSQQRLATLVDDLLTIAEREQQRIGYDLHDGLGQELTGISMLSVALAERLRGDAHPARLVEHAEQVAGLVRESIRHTRDLARGLCPVDLENDGLAAALARLADLVSRFPGVRCTFRADGEPAVEPETAIHLYRIAQEAINNALRHGRAGVVNVWLGSADGRVTLTIDDDGVGFSPDEVAVHTGAGMGLRLMDHRARTVHAGLSVRPRPGGGTRVVCTTDAPARTSDEPAATPL